MSGQKVKIKAKFVPGCHVDCVGGGELELDGVDVEADGDGVEEGLLRLLPELEHRRQDVVPAQLLLLLLLLLQPLLLWGRRELLLLLAVRDVVRVGVHFGGVDRVGLDENNENELKEINNIRSKQVLPGAAISPSPR